MARSGARWRDLPERHGSDQAVKRRFYRWVERDTLGGFLAVLADAGLEWLMIDSTIVRAHQHAAGARRSKGSLMPKAGPLPRRLEHQGPRRHRRARQPGAPAVRAGTAPRRHPQPRVDRRLRASRKRFAFRRDAVIADKGYDADRLREAIRDSEAEAVIPPRSNRKAPCDYDKVLYRERNLTERFFNKLKQFRRVATRYDKLLPNYKGFVQLAAVAILLR